MGCKASTMVEKEDVFLNHAVDADSIIFNVKGEFTQEEFDAALKYVKDDKKLCNISLSIQNTTTEREINAVADFVSGHQSLKKLRVAFTDPQPSKTETLKFFLAHCTKAPLDKLTHLELRVDNFPMEALLPGVAQSLTGTLFPALTNLTLKVTAPKSKDTKMIELCQQIAKHPTIDALTLEFSNSTEYLAKQLGEALPCLSEKLAHFSVHIRGKQTETGLNDILAGLEKYKGLNTFGFRLDEQDLCNDQAQKKLHSIIQNNTMLKKLALRFAVLRDGDNSLAQVFQGFENLKNLTIVHYEAKNNEKFDDAALVNFVDQLKNLSTISDLSLNFSGSGVGDGGISALVGLIKSGKLGKATRFVLNVKGCPNVSEKNVQQVVSAVAFKMGKKNVCNLGNLHRFDLITSAKLSIPTIKAIVFAIKQYPNINFFNLEFDPTSDVKEGNLSTIPNALWKKKSLYVASIKVGGGLKCKNIDNLNNSYKRTRRTDNPKDYFAE